jgi:Ras association domain-containing protein 2/4
MDYSSSSSSQAEARDDTDGSGMSRSLDRRLLRDRDRSGSVMVRKRSASFRKIARQKRKEEAKDEGKLVKRLFTPPQDSSTNLRLSSTIRTNDVVQMLLSKFKAENDSSLYGLFVVHDSGAQEPLSEKHCPLMVRLKLGPSEDIAKLYIMEKSDARAAQISAEVRYTVHMPSGY